MDDQPSHVLRRMPDSSIRVCFDLLKSGEVDAVVSAGNSGATMAVGMVVMGRLAEVDRPALAAVLPALKGNTVLLDVGANVDCPPMMLLQFGYMGTVYAERVLGVKNPSVGLLSIGEEGSKGNNAVRAAHEYFKNSALNFVGNIEGRDLFSGEVSVVVCDGFVGNVCLKLSEGLAESTASYLKQGAGGLLPRWVSGMVMKGFFRRFGKLMDYASYGGVCLCSASTAWPSSATAAPVPAPSPRRWPWPPTACAASWSSTSARAWTSTAAASWANPTWPRGLGPGLATGQGAVVPRARGGRGPRSRGAGDQGDARIGRSECPVGRREKIWARDAGGLGGPTAVQRPAVHGEGNRHRPGPARGITTVGGAAAFATPARRHNRRRRGKQKRDTRAWTTS